MSFRMTIIKKTTNNMCWLGCREKKKKKKNFTGLYKKDLHDPDNHDGVITHLEPGILECEVKWALESITTIINSAAHIHNGVLLSR